MNVELSRDEIEPLFDEGPACEFCGCTEFNACSSGCAWSELFLNQGRAVCTECEAIAICLEINLGAFGMLLRKLQTSAKSRAA